MSQSHPAALAGEWGMAGLRLVFAPDRHASAIRNASCVSAPILDSISIPSDTSGMNTFFVQTRRMHDWLASRHRLRAPFGET
jgi:hypothetical protein